MKKLVIGILVGILLLGVPLVRSQEKLVDRILFWKKLTVPVSNETHIKQSVQLWEVRWQSRYGEFSSTIQPEMEAFPSQEEAEVFAESLRNAFTLIRHTYGNQVSVTKAKSY